MKVTVKTPNITQYNFVFEPTDDIYYNCTWADINLDNDTYALTAVTDCGNYAYCWSPTPDVERFKALMARIGGEYLLGKIAEENVFDFEESKRIAIDQAKEDEYTEQQIQDIEWIDYCGIEEFIRQIREVTEWEYEYIPVVERYPPGAIAFAKVFTEYLQPILRGG